MFDILLFLGIPLLYWWTIGGPLCHWLESFRGIRIVPKQELDGEEPTRKRGP